MILLKAELFPLIPDIGIIFWTTILFLIVWVFLGRKLFKPITTALKKREEDINKALLSAEEAKKEMKALQAQNDQILIEARAESAKIISEAKDMSNKMVSDAKDKAKEEANRILTSAKQEIVAEKNSAMAEVKKEVGSMAVSIAEQLLRRELNDKQAQSSYAQQLMENMSKN